MPNDSHQHVVKTTSQWNERAVEYWVVPRGCLCVELTPDGKTKLKIGEGNKYYHQLPYVTDGSDLSQYYTKEEIDNLLNNFNRMAIMDTEEKESKDDLPLDDNKLGDVYLVKSQDPSTKPDPDVYLWTGSKWIYVGYDFTNIDLSHYLTKEEFHQLFDNVQEKVDIMWPKMHSHQNINVLDRIEEPYTTAEKEKLAGLRNYDSDINHINYDIDLLMADKHHHDNKSFLDTITEEYQIWSIADREKFDNIPDYSGVIAEIQYEIQVLNEKSHTHGIDGKGTLDILNRIEEPYTTSEKEKLAGLENYSDFIGTNGMYSGTHGLVPAPSTRDVGKVLSSTGTWVSLPEITVDDFIGATDSIDGVHGLVPAPLAGEETYFLKGDGTWSEVPEYELPPATTTTLGGIIVGDNLTIDEDGVLDSTDTTYDAGNGLFLGVEYTHNQNTDIPETYLQVEYLESTGTQYINTGQRYDTGYYHYEVDCEIADENNNQIFGMKYWYDHAIDIYGGVYQACDSSYIINSTIPAGDRVYCTLDRPTKTTTIESDSTTFTHTFSGDYSPSSSVYPVVLFAYWTSWSDSLSGYGKGKIYSFKYYSSSDTLTREMYPCVRKSDNVPGMYDTVNNVFYTNNGTGDFSYGDPLTVTDYIPGNTFNVKLGSGLYFDSNGNIAASGGGGGSDYTAGEGIDITIHTGTIPVDMFTGKENLYENYAYTSRTSSEAVPYSLVVLSRNSSAWTEPIGDEFYIEAYDNNDKPLWAYLTFYNSSNNHYYESDPSKAGTHDNLSNYSSYTQALEHVGIGINRLPDSATVWDINSRMNISPSEIKSITLVWYDSTPSDTKTISTKLGEGLDFDANNAITAKLGSGLYFDSSGRIAASGGGGGTTYQAGDGINITSDATPVIEAKLGEGLYFDTNDSIAADIYTAGQGISMSNPSGINVLNQDYYFDTRVTCSLYGSFQRSFQKTTDEPALGALINVHNVGQSDSWTGPVFVGLTESSVKCTYNTDGIIGPFTYKGKTWYCTGANYWVDGSLTDDNHNILRIPGQNQAVYPDEINDLTIAKLIIDTAGLLENNDKVITAKLGSGLRFDSNDAIEVEPQYVRVSTTDSFVLLHTKPSDWDTNWDKYYELTYDQLPGVPPDWDPTKHYKYINDNYVLGSPGDTFVSTTWYDKHYNSLDPNTPVVFDSDVYYTGALSLITDGENFDTAFEKVNEAIQHIEHLENEVEFLKDNSIGIRTTSDPERIEFYRN